MNNAQRYLQMVKDELIARGERPTNYRVAKTLLISDTTVSNWENGRNGIGIIDGYRIAKFLNLDALTVVKELHDDPFKEEEMRSFFIEALEGRNNKRSNDAA